MGITTTKQQKDIEEIEQLLDHRTKSIVCIGGEIQPYSYSVIILAPYNHTYKLSQKYNIDYITNCGINGIEIIISKK